MQSLERWFGVREAGSSLRREVAGGAATFVAMAYIVVVNPAILAFAGLPTGPSTIATILTATFGTLLMGLWANRPIAVAPYMGENAFLAFGLAALHVTWEQRLATVFVAGVAFLAVAAAGIGPWLARAIPTSLKHAFAVGIGLFLVLVGLYEAGIVTSGAAGQPASALADASGLLRAPPAALRLGDVRDGRVLLAIEGFLLVVVLQARRVRGAILLAMAAVAVAGRLAGLGEAPTAVFAWPFGRDPGLSAIALHLDVPGVLSIAFLPVLLTLLLVSFLDTVGTLVGLGAAGDLLDERGDFPEIERPMVVNALSCIAGAALGTSTSGAFIESAVGIREGARTGLASVVTAALFGATLFLLPLVEPLQKLAYVYAPALVAVGIAMLPAVRGIDFDDPTELAPAVVAIAMMAFSYNVANGLVAGLLLHPLLKLATGRVSETTAGGWLLAAVCAFYVAFGLPH
ncbi:MAG: NCS2 family permease [Alphaproteobacteria bacterium]